MVSIGTPVLTKRPAAKLRVAVVLLGCATAVMQTLALREGMAAVGGNETVVAVLLGIWMIGTALGALPGLGKRAAWAPSALVGYGLLIPATLVAVRAAALLGSPGQPPSMAQTASVGVLLLLPSCMLAGWLYATLAEMLQSCTGGPATAYWLDTLGSGLAGAALGIFLLERYLPMHVAAMGTCAVAIGAVLGGARKSWLLVPLCAVIVGALCVLPVDRWTLQWESPGATLQQLIPSARGTILVSEAQGQTTLSLRKQLLSISADDEHAEQLAHLSLALHPHPERVCVIGAVGPEVLEKMPPHGVRSIEVVAGDETIAHALRSRLAPDLSSTVVFSGQDERAWPRRSQARCDVIEVVVPPPVSISGARLFSKEFYSDLSEHVAGKGILVIVMPGHASYATSEERAFHSSVLQTLRAVFPHALIVPADSTFYVASKQPLPDTSSVVSTISARIHSRGIHPAFVHDTWISDRLGPSRLNDAVHWASARTAPSTDLRPVVHTRALTALLAQVGESAAGALLPALIALAALGLGWFRPRSRPIPFSLATTGLWSLCLQLVLMVAYQTAVGALVRDVALLNAAFMGASCAGTLVGMRMGSGRLTMGVSDAAQVALSVLVALAMGGLVECQGASGRVILVGVSAIVGLSSGVHVGLASRLLQGSVGGHPGTILATDMAGAAIGAAIALTLLVPWVGLAGTAVAVGGLKIASSVALVLPTPLGQPSPPRGVVPVLLLVLAVVVGVLEATQPTVSAWTSRPTYGLLVVVVLCSMLLMVFETGWMHSRLLALERSTRATTRRLGVSPLRMIGFLVMLPLAALPIARCYFRVPFLFCHACPRPCVFGIARAYLVPAALIGNFGDRRFCERLCPLGLAQTAACRRGRVRSGTRAWLRRLRGLLLIGVALAYFLIEVDHSDADGLFAVMFMNRSSVSRGVLAVAAVLLAISFLFWKPFCDAVCPIGAASSWIDRLARRVDPAFKHDHPDS